MTVNIVKSITNKHSDIKLKIGKTKQW